MDDCGRQPPMPGHVEPIEIEEVDDDETPPPLPDFLAAEILDIEDLDDIWNDAGEAQQEPRAQTNHNHQVMHLQSICTEQAQEPEEQHSEKRLAFDVEEQPAAPPSAVDSRSKFLFATMKEGLSTEDFWALFLEEQYILSTRHDVNRWRKAAWKLTRESGRRTLIYTYSVLALLGMKRVRLVLLLICALCIAQAGYFGAIMYRQSTEASTFRFTAQKLRRTHIVHVDNVVAIGVSYRMCAEWAEISNTTKTSITISYPSPVKMNGFSFRLDGPVEEDPVRWRVEALKHSGAFEPILRDTIHEWQLIPPEHRAEGEVISMQILSEAYWGAFATAVVSAIGVILIVLLAFLNYTEAAKHMLSVTLCAVALSYLIGELCDRADPTPARLADAILLILLAPCIILHYFERYLAQALMIAGIVSWIFLALVPAAEAESEWIRHRQQQILTSTLLFIGCLLFGYRRFVLIRLSRKIKRDTAVMDASFKHALAKCYRDGGEDLADFHRVLDELAGCVRCGRHACGIPAHEVVQTSVLMQEGRLARTESMGGDDGFWKELARLLNRKSWQVREAKMVRSLEQLYAQGQCQMHVLRRKCKELAEECGGMVPLEPRQPHIPDVAGALEEGGPNRRQYAKWVEVKNDRPQAALVRWTKLKPYKRAMEKVVYHYDGETARLLDVTREMLVFDSFRSLAHCLRTLQQDPEVLLQSTHNTLDEDYDATRSAGFRGVFVKLLLVNDVSRDLETAAHVCELILTLRCIAELVSDDSYHDYLLLRRLEDASKDFQRPPVQAEDHIGWGLQGFGGAPKGGGVREIDLNRHARIGGGGGQSPEFSPGGEELSLQSNVHTGGGSSIGSRISASLPPVFSPWRPSLPPPNNRVFPDPPPSHVTPHMGHSPGPVGPSPVSIPVESVPVHSQLAVGNDKERVREEEGELLSHRSADGRGSSNDDGRPSRLSSVESNMSAASGMSSNQGSPERMLAEVRRTKEEKLALVYAAEYRKRTALKGRDLDQWWENLGRATASANFANVFNTSFPLSSAIEKRWFILFAATIAAGCVVYALQFLTLGNLSAEIKINMLRFTVHARRGEWAALDSSGIGRDRADLQLGLERGGCTTPLNLEELHGTTVEQGPKWTRVTADLHNVTSVDGFFVTTHPTIPDLDPSVFEIEVVRPGEDATWHRVASSRKFVPRDGRIQWLLEPMRTLPDKRGAKVDISLRYPVYAWLRQLASTLIVGLAAALLAWISFMGFYTWGKSVIVATIVITAALHLTEAVMRMTDHNYVGFPLQYATGASLVLFAAAVYRYERYFMESITVTSLVILTCALLEDLWLDPDVLRLTDQVPSIFAALVGMVLIAVRWISKRKAVKAIFEDFATYQRVWDKLVGDSKEVADMKRIPLVLSKAPLVLSKSSIRQEMHTTLPEGYVRHRNSVTALREKSSSDIGRSSALGGVSFLSLFTGGLSYSFQKFNPLRRNSAADPLRLFTGAQAQPKLNRRMSDAARYLARSLTFMKRMGGQIKLEPVMSLRLLYTQAAALHPLVQHKIKGWALHSAGLFPTKSQKKSDATEFVKWSDVSGDLAQEVRIKWATLKKPERAIEKLVRTYGGTVWMVQDLVRQSIVFEKTGELLKCLELIIQDRDVRVIGAKNRLHKAHDSLSTGGYRDVHLNMQLKTPLAHKLGIDQHVFEIQLQLLAYSECKISGGHTRYVAFRNALCM